MHECSGFRSAAARRCCSEITHTSDPGNKPCALTVSLLLSFSEAAHDSAVMNHIHNRTVVCGLRESPPRAHSTCTSLHFHCMHLASHITIVLRAGGGPRARATCADHHPEVLRRIVSDLACSTQRLDKQPRAYEHVSACWPFSLRVCGFCISALMFLCKRWLYFGGYGGCGWHG